MEKSSRNASLIIGLIMIFLGIIWLLSMLNTVHFSLWYIIDVLLFIWPLIIVCAGLSLLTTSTKLIKTIWIGLLALVIVLIFLIAAGDNLADFNFYLPNGYQNLFHSPYNFEGMIY
jgi:hypothetical protein